MKGFLLKTIASILTSLLLGGSAFAADAPIRFANLGMVSDDLYQYLAIDKGIYHKFGLDLELTSFLRGGPGLVAAAASGQIDLGDVGTPILTAISRGIPLKIVGAPTMKREEFLLVGLPSIHSVKALEGLTVGVGSVGGGEDQALRKILSARGLSPSGVKIIAYGNTASGYIALKSGRLAAVVIEEPEASRSEAEGSGRLLAKAVDYYGRYEQSYIFASRDFLDNHSDLIRRYFKANRAAIDYAAAHPDELIAYGESKLNLSKDVSSRVFRDELSTWDPSQSVDVVGMLNAIKIVKELGDIDASYQPVVGQITDLRFNGQNEKDAER